MKKPQTHASAYNSFSLEKLYLFILVMFVSTSISAQEKLIQLYGGAAPGSENWKWNEKETNKNMLNTRIVYNVTHPTLTVFLPDSAIVLRYRLTHSLTDDPWQEMMSDINDSEKYSQRIEPVVKMAVEDGNAAISYVRQHAGEFSVDVKRIGLMGFSAGGNLAASVAYSYTPETRPDFVVPIYAPTAGIKKTNVQQDAPPMFISAASDDHLVPVANSVNLYNDWIASKHSAELHFYSKGDHGLQGFPASNWIVRFEEWLDVQGLLKVRQ